MSGLGEPYSTMTFKSSNASVDSSRRAFPLDSRARWVEQLIDKGMIIPKDNLSIGPATYNVKIQQVHVSTPSIGGSRGLSDRYHPYKNRSKNRPLSRDEEGVTERPFSRPTNSSQGRRKKRKNKSKPDHSPTGLEEYSTIFHNHDTREPLDPKESRCSTPGPYLEQDSVFRSVNTYGINQPKGITTFGVAPKHSPIKQTLPYYDVKYESPQVRSTIKVGKFSKSNRIHIPLKGQHRPLTAPSTNELNQTSISTYNDTAAMGRSQSSYGMDATTLSPIQYKESLVKLPKLKFRAKANTNFDSSCYKTKYNHGELNITPSKVNNEAKINIFRKLILTPKTHKSQYISSSMIASPMN